MKKLAAHKLNKIYVASNCPKKFELVKLCGLVGAEIINLEENSKELAVVCKKPFSVSVVGFE